MIGSVSVGFVGSVITVPGFVVCVPLLLVSPIPGVEIGFSDSIGSLITGFVTSGTSITGSVTSGSIIIPPGNSGLWLWLLSIIVCEELGSLL